ncbi:Rpn family recombination-promoting nuclease/putative transposase [Spirulina sp. CS-785/01]|uniref:Rpn family recombination-promoting nuclease/putative transposase n=1 Tax=Spirulina sp. CS-785/01 TaxID=3021716 RepID=UPI00232ABD55|nr:Rpn family recombination-promoting nuclease/putative transposase [Spirulina sp. CS-785/01]MDB9315347.1 Rpn family recombination-promoting nuclease/putative transposase [Spirulina sp. CS-785/01]
MNFIDPKTDFAFKRIFGSPDSPEILLSFVNGLLYEGNPIVESLEIRPPLHNSTVNTDSPLVAKAQLKEGETCLIEMQFLNLFQSGKWILYKAAKSYALQINKGERNPQIKPLMTINLADSLLFGEESNIISRFVLKEVDQLFDYPYSDFGLVFVELPKFTKTINELETLTDKWLFFFKNLAQLESIPETLGNIPEIRKAFELADENTLNREEFDLLQQQLFILAEQRRFMTSGQEQGLRQGIEQGREQGIQEGLQQGINQGRRQGLEQGRQQGLQAGLEQGREQGIQEGREEGIQSGQLALILRLLRRRFGKLDKASHNKIQQLNREQLEQLAEAAWDFITDLELKEWLEKQE